MIVVVYDPAMDAENVQETLTVPPDGIVALEGQEIVTPEGAAALKFTTPANPWRLVSVTVPVADEPALTETLDGVDTL